MAKTKPIGVRFDEDLLNEVKANRAADSPQRALNLYEKTYKESLVVVQDLTKSNVSVNPPKQAENTDGTEKGRKEQILAEIEAINAETKPSMMAKSTYELAKKKRLAKLEAELEDELYRITPKALK